MHQVLDSSMRIKTATRACSHCGLATIAKQSDELAFCCAGCRGAFQLIHSMGLEDYYSLRSLYSAEPNHQSERDDGRAEVLEDLETAGVQVHVLSADRCSVRLSVAGLHCAACTWLIERIQPSIPGLVNATVRMSDRTIELIYDPIQTRPVDIARKLGALGYSLSPWVVDDFDDQSFLLLQREHWFGIALAAFFAANAMWMGVALYAGEATGIASEHQHFLRWVGTILGLFAVVFPGRIFFATAWQAIRTRTPHVDIPVALSLFMGMVGSLVGSVNGVGHIYFDSLSSLILLLRIGRYIQFRAQYRTNLSLSKLLRWNSVTATLVDSEGKRTCIPAHRLQIGDRVEVMPGQSIPADGVLVKGLSCVDTSFLNGENTPLAVRMHDVLIAGTTNISSPIILNVTASGAESRVGQLMELVRNAASHRTPSIQAADRVSKWFVIAVLLLAVVTWAVWAIEADATVATQHTMALLTIACPCALALAAPLVLTVALGRAAQKKIWIRDGGCLERMAVPGMIWMDKTGTLTCGRLQVLAWHGDEATLQTARALERCVSHPIANAICDFADANRYCPTSIEALASVPGKGATAEVDGHRVVVGSQAWLVEQGFAIANGWLETQANALQNNRSVVFVSVDREVRGLFEIADPLRHDTVNTLQRITAMGWKVGILSGDRQEIVDHFASELTGLGVPIDSALGQQSPEEKWNVVKRTMASMDGPCAMVGDGINDAAALSLADVGIAVRGGSTQSLSAARIYIASGRLSSVADLLSASRFVVRGIRRCFVASLVYNSLSLTLAMLGWIHPLIAAVLMPISGLTVLAMAMSTTTFVGASEE
jgi:P-type Cu2+ transporter